MIDQLSIVSTQVVVLLRVALGLLGPAAPGLFESQVVVVVLPPALVVLLDLPVVGDVPVDVVVPLDQHLDQVAAGQPHFLQVPAVALELVLAELELRFLLRVGLEEGDFHFHHFLQLLHAMLFFLPAEPVLVVPGGLAVDQEGAVDLGHQLPKALLVESDPVGLDELEGHAVLDGHVVDDALAVDLVLLALVAEDVLDLDEEVGVRPFDVDPVHQELVELRPLDRVPLPHEPLLLLRPMAIQLRPLVQGLQRSQLVIVLGVAVLHEQLPILLLLLGEDQLDDHLSDVLVGHTLEVALWVDVVLAEEPALPLQLLDGLGQAVDVVGVEGLACAGGALEEQPEDLVDVVVFVGVDDPQGEEDPFLVAQDAVEDHAVEGEQVLRELGDFVGQNLDAGDLPSFLVDPQGVLAGDEQDVGAGDPGGFGVAQDQELCPELFVPFLEGGHSGGFDRLPEAIVEVVGGAGLNRALVLEVGPDLGNPVLEVDQALDGLEEQPLHPLEGLAKWRVAVVKLEAIERAGVGAALIPDVVQDPVAMEALDVESLACRLQDVVLQTLVQARLLQLVPEGVVQLLGVLEVDELLEVGGEPEVCE